LPKYKTVIEVRGCYWHRHEGCLRKDNYGICTQRPATTSEKS
jgi:G:T-mismatch repair DNA endonuclease (very short patch repair protein)